MDLSPGGIGYWVSSNHCRGQSIQSRGARSKSRGAKVYFIDFSPEKHAVHDAITSIYNSLMQSKIIGVASSKLLFWSISVIISNIILLILARESGEALQAQWGSELRPGSQNVFRFYIASNPPKAVKNIIWLINL